MGWKVLRNFDPQLVLLDNWEFGEKEAAMEATLQCQEFTKRKFEGKAEEKREKEERQRLKKKN